MKKDYFKNSWQWREEDVDTIGLPRPFAFPNRRGMAKKAPIPWQSEDRFASGGHLGLNLKNEDKVFDEDLCPYCGIKINNEDVVIRWNTQDLVLFNRDSRWVYSDLHPFHIECMDEGRIFCPFMRKLKDKDFETGKYVDLKINAIRDKNKSVEIRNNSIWIINE
jgi:hypothetical protein